ncbi:hypothetical protein GOV10_03020 [Candidatus Woesearchaeota archaeon]|nr:hypothetical protein [Candidatus Woesearchaeota archaeon]
MDLLKELQKKETGWELEDSETVDEGGFRTYVNKPREEKIIEWTFGEQISYRFTRAPHIVAYYLEGNLLEDLDLTRARINAEEL